MLAMGCIKALIIDKVSNGKVSIDVITSFLTQVVLADLHIQESGEFYSSKEYQNFTIQCPEFRFLEYPKSFLGQKVFFKCFLYQ